MVTEPTTETKNLKVAGTHERDFGLNYVNTHQQRRTVPENLKQAGQKPETTPN